MGTGLRVMQRWIEAESAPCARRRQARLRPRIAIRHGTEAGFVSLGGRRVSVRQPPMRTADAVARGAGAGQEAFCSTELLGRESFIVIADDTPKRSQRTGGHR